MCVKSYQTIRIRRIVKVRGILSNWREMKLILLSGAGCMPRSITDGRGKGTDTPIPKQHSYKVKNNMNGRIKVI